MCSLLSPVFGGVGVSNRRMLEWRRSGRATWIIHSFILLDWSHALHSLLLLFLLEPPRSWRHHDQTLNIEHEDRCCIGDFCSCSCNCFGWGSTSSSLRRSLWQRWRWSRASSGTTPSERSNSSWLGRCSQDSEVMSIWWSSSTPMQPSWPSRSLKRNSHSKILLQSEGSVLFVITRMTLASQLLYQTHQDLTNNSSPSTQHRRVRPASQTVLIKSIQSDMTSPVGFSVFVIQLPTLIEIMKQEEGFIRSSLTISLLSLLLLSRIITGGSDLKACCWIVAEAVVMKEIKWLTLGQCTNNED